MKESLEKIFSLSCFTKGGFCLQTNNVKVIDKDKNLIWQGLVWIYGALV